MHHGSHVEHTSHAEHNSHGEQSGQSEQTDHSNHAKQTDHSDNNAHESKADSNQQTANTHGSHQHSTTDSSSGKSFYTTFSATSETTFKGSHRIDLIPAKSEIPLIELHHWYVKVFDQSGEEIRPDELQISGSMPAHGHGLPTRPIVEGYTDTKGYRITNVSFNMAGNWKFIVEFNSVSYTHLTLPTTPYV